MSYSVEKATALAVSFLAKNGKELEGHRLMKLMYLAEREAIRVRNAGITGDTFYSIHDGPILSVTSNLMSGKLTGDWSAIWHDHVQTSGGGYTACLIQTLDPSLHLSKRESDVAENIWDVYGDIETWDLVELMRTFPEWDRRAYDHKTSIPIATIDILESLGFAGEEIDRRLSELDAVEAFDRLLRLHADPNYDERLSA